MKKVVIALCGVVALGAAGCTLIAWNTGKLMPERINAMLEHANQQLQVALGHEGEATIELLSLSPNTFSSDARYRVTYQAVGRDPVLLEFADHIEYGPLPWSKVKQLQLMPVMAASNFSLEKTQSSSPWFAFSKGEVPVQGHITVNYDETVSTQISVAPLEIFARGVKWDSSAISLRMDSIKGAETVRVVGKMANLKVQQEEKSPYPLVLDLEGATLIAQLGAGAHGLHTGWLKMNLRDIRLALGDKALSFGRFARHDTYEFAEDGYSARQTFSVENMQFAGWPYGSARLVWRAEGLDPAALRNMLNLRNGPAWNQIKAAAAQEASAAATGGAQSQDDAGTEFHAALSNLLANRPRVVVEELSFKTSGGESRADLEVQLRRPDTDDSSLAGLVTQMSESARINLKLSKATVDAWEGPFSLRMYMRDINTGQPLSRRWWDIVSREARRDPLLVVTDDSVVMDLRLKTPDDIELNGKKINREEFSRVIGRAAAQ